MLRRLQSIFKSRVEFLGWAYRWIVSGPYKNKVLSAPLARRDSECVLETRKRHSDQHDGHWFGTSLLPWTVSHLMMHVGRRTTSRAGKGESDTRRSEFMDKMAQRSTLSSHSAQTQGLRFQTTCRDPAVDGAYVQLHVQGAK